MIEYNFSQYVDLRDGVNSKVLGIRLGFPRSYRRINILGHEGSWVDHEQNLGWMVESSPLCRRKVTGTRVRSRFPDPTKRRHHGLLHIQGETRLYHDLTEMLRRAEQHTDPVAAVRAFSPQLETSKNLPNVDFSGF